MQISAVYGTEHLAERLQAVGDLGALRVRDPRKYALPFIRNAWGTLGHRWVREIKAITNVLSLRALVARAAYDQLKPIGLTSAPCTNKKIYPIRSLRATYLCTAHPRLSGTCATKRNFPTGIAIATPQIGVPINGQGRERSAGNIGPAVDS